MPKPNLYVCILSLDQTLLNDPNSSDTFIRFSLFKPLGVQIKFLVPDLQVHSPLIAYLKLIFALRRLLSQNTAQLVVANNPVLGFLALPICRLYNVKLQVSVFGTHLFNLSWILNSPHHLIFWLFEWLAIISADTIRFDTHLDQEKLIKQFHLHRSQTIVIPVIPNPAALLALNQGKSNPGLKLQLAGGNALILSIGTLTPNKDFGNALRSFPPVLKQFPRVTWVIVGDGPERKILMSEAKKLKLLKHVVFLGSFDYAKLPELYHAADLYVCSSNQEGLPRVLIEAITSRCPVVTTDITGAADVIIPGKTGTIVPKNNPSLLGKAILWHLNHQTESKRMAKAAYTANQAYFEFKRQSQRLLASWTATINHQSLSKL